MSGNRVNQAIPSFINGVSQQPPTVRLSSQCELLINSLPTVSDGTSKRPPTYHKRKLWDGQMGEIFSHTINRDEQERYQLFITNGDLKVVDLLNGGVELAVDFPNGKDYLSSSNPRDSFAAVTIADFTFVVNRNVVVELTDEKTPEISPEALVYVKNGYSSTTYKITVDDETATHTTASSSTQPNTQNIASSLKTALEGLDVDLTVEIKGSVLKIVKTDGSEFTFSVTDSWGEQAMIGIKKQVAKFTDLPAKAFDGFKVKVTGESKGEDDDYYVQYDSEGGTRNGTWDECRGWDTQSDFDFSTMPHVLIRAADGTFVFKEADGAEPYEGAIWEPAKVGDDESCKPPAFIGQTINAVYFHQNRLGFLSGENAILSRDAEFFNFWPKTATTQVATDPIDYASSDEKVSTLFHAVPFHDALSLFASQVQFQLTNGGNTIFGPETIRIDPSTRYDCSTKCPPIACGQNLYFLVENKDYSAVMEYFVTSDAVTLDATDVTAHVPRCLPSGAYKMIGSTNENYLLIASTKERNALWLYKFFWIDEDKVQSAWSKWLFPENDRVISIAGVGADVYLVFQREDGVYLEHVYMQSQTTESDMNYLVHLDRRARIDGVYDTVANKTTWELPYPAEGLDLSIVLGSAFVGKAGRELKPEVIDNIATVDGKYDDGPCICGFQYESRLRFSEQFIRESKDASAPVISEGRLQLLNFAVLHRNSGYFYAEVRAKGRSAVVKKHLGTIGDGRFRIGSPVIDSKPFRFSVMARSSQVEIDLVNDRHFPSNFLSAEWTGLYSLDSQRV